jgi:two-component system chemotaxis response regulator CheV
MSSVLQDVDERSNLAGRNKFELLLFKLGSRNGEDRNEIFGINVFKIREIVAMPVITPIAGSGPNLLGVVNLRGEIIPVLDLPAIAGCVPEKGLNIMLVTEFARTTQAFAVESVDEIVRLEWSQVLSAEGTSGGGIVASIARLDGSADHSRLAQVLDVETIVRMNAPKSESDIEQEVSGEKVSIAPGKIVIAADDSTVARALIEQGLTAMDIPYQMMKTGQEAWEKLQQIASEAKQSGGRASDRVAMVLTDLEMPEMDGFTLTKNIKDHADLKDIPVVIHSSLSGVTNEAKVREVGADGYVAKFAAAELAKVIKKALS